VNQSASWTPCEDVTLTVAALWIVGELLAPFSGPVSLLLLWRRLDNPYICKQSCHEYKPLTGWIRDNSVKEFSTSPWIICHVEGTKINNSVGDAILSGRSDDSRLFICVIVLYMGLWKRKDKMAPLPLICRPSISEPNTCAPKWAAVWFKLSGCFYLPGSITRTYTILPVPTKGS